MLRRILSIGIVLIAAVIFVHGQTTAEPSPTPFRGRPETGLEKIRRIDRENERRDQEMHSRLHGQGAYANSPRFSREWREKTQTLYRKLNEKELKMLQPYERYRKQYAKLLAEKDTGMFRIIPDQGCEGDGKVVNASPICRKFGFPGAGSSYSFRMDSHRISRLSDITLVGNSLRADGVFNGAMFVQLGNVPISEVDLNTSGLRYLSNYQTFTEAKDALKAAKLLAKGVKKDGFIYGRGVFAIKDTTFAMRSIAYRGKLLRSEAGVVYNELDFDKRRDIIVAFRIIDVAPNGILTIVWKMLRQTKSPKLKMEKKDK